MGKIIVPNVLILKCLNSSWNITNVTYMSSSVQSLSRVWLFATPWTAAHQTSLSITSSRSLLKLMSTESVMPSNHLILCHPLPLPSSMFPIIRVFADESALRIRWPVYWQKPVAFLYTNNEQSEKDITKAIWNWILKYLVINLEIQYTGWDIGKLCTSCSIFL